MSRLLAVMAALLLIVNGCGSANDVVGAAPPKLEIASGNNQSGAISSPLAVPLSVSVTTVSGSPVAGVVVTWSVKSGGGIVSASSVPTDAAGSASTEWTLGNTAGAQSVAASVGGHPDASTLFSATALPLVVSKEVGDTSTGVVGQGVTLAIVVKDPNGNPLGKEDIEWSAVTGGGSITSAMSQTDAAGWASASWKLGPTLGGQTATAVVKRFNVPVVFSATVQAAPPPTTYVLALHYDGTAWTTSLKYDHTGCCGDALFTVWGASPAAVFAGGGTCYPFIIRYDGSAWLDPPDCGGGLNDTRSISGISATDAYAVSHSAYPPNTSYDVAHFDGVSWTSIYHQNCSLIVQVSCGAVLSAVWGRAHNDATVVGDAGKILHYDGSAWTQQSSGTTASLYGVWGDAATGSIFTVGAGGTILFNDGTAWVSQASGTTQGLRGVWGSSPSDVFAVGDGGVIVHYDGHAWTLQNSGTTSDLRGVWSNSSSSAFAVGEGTILHYDGSTWSKQTLPVAMSLNGVWGSSPTDVFVVGRSTN
jgi:hypothetical protein